MAKLPWVSRELYDRVVEDLRKSEIERKQLLDRMLGIVPEASVEAVERLLVDKAMEPEGLFAVAEDPSSPAGMRKMAQNAAYKRAGRVAV